MCYIRTSRPETAVIYNPRENFRIGQAKVRPEMLQCLLVSFHVQRDVLKPALGIPTKLRPFLVLVLKKVYRNLSLLFLRKECPANMRLN